jgi:class 3 adenylate cyclase
MSQSRRLAAVLAADVAGYSRLMGLDEAGTARALREHRVAADPLIAEQGERIVKTTGDGVLIEFGSVVGAVQSRSRCKSWQRKAMWKARPNAVWNAPATHIRTQNATSATTL